MKELSIRLATAADLHAINNIYNHYVLHSTCTYQFEPETMANREAWFARHGARHPVTVAEVRGEVIGWGSLSPFHSRAAYARSVEDSLYVRHDIRRSGVGTALLKDLVVRARESGHHTIIAGIDAEQAASVAVHERQGFVEVARLKEVGLKFNRWLDVIYMQLLL